MTAAKKAAAADIPNDKLIRLYHQMVAIRLFEERVNDLYTRALMPGLAHLYIGEEAIAVGVCEALAERRLHHQHAPRPRPLPGQGRVARPDVRGAARQGSRLLQGQGRLDAHRRPGHRQPRRQRHRRRQRRHCHRRGVRVEVSEDREGGRLLLRRGRARPGAALRRAEPRAAVAAAGDLRVREQRLQRVHALLGVHRRRRGEAAGSLRHGHRDRRRPERARDLRHRARSTSSAPAAAAARRSCSSRPTATTATTWATSPAPTTVRRPRSRSG